jgi:hypothetical protein
MHDLAPFPAAGMRPGGPRVTVTRAGGDDPAMQLAREGWTLVRGVFPEPAVADLRARVEAAFADPAAAGRVISPYGCGSILPDLTKMPGVWPAVFTPALCEALRRVLGPGFVLLPEHAIHRDGFGDWHKDTDMFETVGLQDHWSPGYGVYQCAVYLQDNSPVHGGGLSAVPGSHRVPRTDPRDPEGARRYRETAQANGVPLPSRAGDLVVFHTRLDHRATPCERPSPTGPKLAVFLIAAHDDAHAARYLDFIRRRPDYRWLHDHVVPAPLQALAREHGFRLAT